MRGPILVLPLSKAGWSDEARAAALAARQASQKAKAEGLPSDVQVHAASIAKSYAENGMKATDAVKIGVRDAEQLHQSEQTVKDHQGPQKFATLEDAQNTVEGHMASVLRLPGVEKDWNNQHDSEYLSIGYTGNDKSVESKIASAAKDAVTKIGNPDVMDHGWTWSNPDDHSEGRYYSVEVYAGPDLGLE